MILKGKPVTPSFRTSPEEWSREEWAKLRTKGFTSVPEEIKEEFRNDKEDLSFEAETIAKSCGIYLEFNRDRFRRDGVKEFIYMIRIVVPGGGPITARQWKILDEISDQYTISDAYTGEPKPSLRLTTRQDVQLHHVRKRDLLDAIREIAKSGFFTLNGCGDNVRNVVACPLSSFSKIFNANSLAKSIASYFRLPTGPYLEIFEIDPAGITERGTERFNYSENLLNRKFKIAVSGLHELNGKILRDNCVEVRTNDIGIVPVDGRKFQIYVGGGQGEKQGISTFSCLGRPLGIFSEEELMRALHALVEVQQEWGDRKNRQWARMKYLVHSLGIGWFQEQLKVRGISFEPPDEELDVGPRMLHLGRIEMGIEGYGLFIENGRVIDREGMMYKTMLRDLADSYPGVKFFITPNQHLLITDVDDVKELERFMRNYLKRTPSKLRTMSIACVGFPTCKLSFTESERFLPNLMSKLEQEWGDMEETIGVSGCLAQCSRPGTKTIGWIGTGYNLYMLKIGGDAEGRNQGGPLVDPETGETYLTHVPGERVADVTQVLFQLYRDLAPPELRRPGGMGPFLRSLGNKRIIEYLKADPRTRDLMRSTIKAEVKT